jgi:streptogramin lyase
VTNYSPYNFSGEIHGLVSDNSGGVWFGVYNNVEHIDTSGRMSQYVMPEWLWEIYGFSRDTSGRLWFSLGQSGRIGTIDSNGALRTRIVVPRRYLPDLREIAFDSGGNLWFMDFGRRSVGELSANGVLREEPVTDPYKTHLVLRHDRPYVAYYSYWDPDLTAQMQPLSEARLQASGKLTPLQRVPEWLSRAPIRSEMIDESVTSPNGDVWLALNAGNAPLAITRLSRRP